MTSNTSESRKKSTLWNFFFLNIGFLISLFNGLLIIPLYLHYIDSSVYGAWLATGSILTWMSIIDPGVGNVLLQRVAYAIGKNDKQELGLSINSGFLISAIMFILSVLIGLALSFFISGIAKIDARYQAEIVSAFRIAMWGTAFSLIANTFTSIILAYQKTKIHGIFLNGIMLASTFLTILLLFLHTGVYALAYSNLFRGGGLFIYTLIFSIKLIKKNRVELKFNLQYFKSFSKVFVYTFSSKILDSVASNIDLIIVSRFVGNSAVTVLDLSRRPLKIVSGLTNNITQAILPSLPHLYGSGQNDKFKATVVKIWSIITWASAFIIGGFALFNHSLINNWVGSKFWVGNTNNMIMCIAFFFLSITYGLSNITHSMGEMQSNSVINIVRNVVYLSCMIIFARIWNITGILLSFLVSLLFLVFYFPRKVMKIAQIQQGQKSAIINNSIISTIIVGFTVVFSLIYDIRASWIYLFIYSGLYAIAYGLTLFFTSREFRDSILSLKGDIHKKLNVSLGRG